MRIKLIVASMGVFCSQIYWNARKLKIWGVSNKSICIYAHSEQKCMWHNYWKHWYDYPFSALISGTWW